MSDAYIEDLHAIRKWCDANRNLANAERVGMSDRKSLPPVSGVYFVLDGIEVLYVGVTKNLRNRWIHHHRQAFVPDTAQIAFFRVPYEQLVFIEWRFIQLLKPTLNGQRLKHPASLTPHSQSDAIRDRLHPSLRESFIPLEGTDIALHFPGGTEAVVRDLYRLASLTQSNSIPAPEPTKESA